MILLFVCLVAGNCVASAACRPAPVADGGEAEEPAIDLEWVGITVAVDARRLAEVDSALNLDGYTAELEAQVEAASARA